MATIKLAGSAESETGKFILPVSGAAGIYFTNDSQVKLTNNFAKNELSAAVMGILSPNTNYTTMRVDGGYVQTSIKETADLTIFAVYEQPATMVSSGAMIVSTHIGDPSSFGAGLYATTGKVQSLATQNTSSGKTGGQQVVNASGWQLVVARTSGAANHIKNITTGESKTTSYVSRNLGDNPVNYRIGASYTTAYKADVKIMAVVIFNKALTDTEIVSVGDVLRRYAAKHGVNV